MKTVRTEYRCRFSHQDSEFVLCVTAMIREKQKEEEKVVFVPAGRSPI